jgi:hypothetical protein
VFWCASCLRLSCESTDRLPWQVLRCCTCCSSSTSSANQGLSQSTFEYCGSQRAYYPCSCATTGTHGSRTRGSQGLTGSTGQCTHELLLARVRDGSSKMLSLAHFELSTRSFLRPSDILLSVYAYTKLVQRAEAPNELLQAIWKTSTAVCMYTEVVPVKDKSHGLRRVYDLSRAVVTGMDSTLTRSIVCTTGPDG